MSSANPGEGAPAPEGTAGLEFILDLPVEITVELGRRRLTIGEVLALGRGGIVEFSRNATEPLDIRVNDRLIAHGEAVVIGDRYGVRVTDIVSPGERVGSARQEAAP